ncbi:exonuclease 1-like [Corticium candelabrum]|uniref:exonuclease 1-like n=1 Tax=Corticium candelabrum TaxID=121492 RepID=UPI002E25474D|nr:exonuclease 1-like [Corticium candelabrum]
MGIQGLLPFLKDIHERISVSEYAGQTVAIDAYCWLHKGAYGCALQLAQGTKTDLYVKYCMKRVNMMRFHNIRPILVFDGGYLPSKRAKEEERRARRMEYKKRGKRFLSEGERARAIDAFQKCVDVTPEMARDVIQACRNVGVQCIVAPYEADAQLAYMLNSGLVQLVITEDSDLLVFGTDKVLFKMDANGDGVRISLDRLSEVKSLSDFNRDNFRHMCILSGCDYLPSVPGLGLSTACKLMKRNGKDAMKVIRMLRLEGTKKVPPDYDEDFVKADYTFLYQLVFDPSKQILTSLNHVPEHLKEVDMSFAGHHLSPRKARGIACGNINPLNHAVMDSYDSSAARCESVGFSSLASQKVSVALGECRIQAKLRMNTSSGHLSGDSGFESLLGDDDGDDEHTDIKLAQYRNSDLKSESTTEANNPDSTSQSERVMNDLGDSHKVIASPFSYQKPICKRTLFQSEFKAATESLRGMTSRHFNQSQSNVSCQKRKKLSEDSLFASLESSSESTEPESKQLDLQNDQYETSDVTVDKESCISDTDLIDCGRESEEQQSTVSLSQSDDISEVYPTEPVKDAESRPVYVSAFRHHSQSSQKSRYWNQAPQKLMRRRTGLSNPKSKLHQRHSSCGGGNAIPVDRKQSTLFQHFTALDKNG